MERTIQTLRARHGARWVWKTEHSNLAAPSKDALGYVPESATPEGEREIQHGKRLKMFLWDTIAGGSRELNPRAAAHEFREAYVLTPTAVDHIGGTLEPPTEEEGGGGTEDGGIDILDEVRELRRRVQTLEDANRRILSQLGGKLEYGSVISLRMSGGQVLSVPGGGPTESHQTVKFESRPGPGGSWEDLTVVKRTP
jgi:hypothetical protein